MINPVGSGPCPLSLIFSYGGNNMEKTALFAVELHTVKGVSNATLGIFCFPGKKTFDWIVYQNLVDEVQGTTSLICVSASDVATTEKEANPTENGILSKFTLDVTGAKHLFIDTSKESDITKIVILKKFDEPLCAKSGSFESLRLDDTDYLSSKATLREFLKTIPNIEIPDPIPEIKKAESNTVAIAFPRRKKGVSPWDPSMDGVFTEEERKALAAVPDLEVMFANKDRMCCQLIEKELETTTSAREYTLIGVHGAPASGKTTFLLHDYSARHNRAVIYIPASIGCTIAEIMVAVGPVSRGKICDGLEDAIAAVKAKIEAADKSDEKLISELTERLTKLVAASSDTVELERTYSLLAKCLIHNVDAVAVIDEANLISTEELNALSPIISDGTFRDGPFLYHNDYTVQWVLCWNPGTSGTRSFDGKFYDRMHFVNMENIPRETKTAFAQRKQVTAMYGPEVAAIEATIQKLNDAAVKVPERKDELENAQRVIVENQSKASQEAIEWYADYVIRDGYEQSKFNNAFLEDVTPAGRAETARAIGLISYFIEDLNKALYSATRGKDTKNPDPTWAFYISDRAAEIFQYYIYGYRDVKTAVLRYLFDMFPGGNTLKRQTQPKNNSRNSSSADTESYGPPNEDVYPWVLAASIIETMTAQIDELQAELFSAFAEEQFTEAETLRGEAVFCPIQWDDGAGAAEAPDEEGSDLAELEAAFG